MVLILSLGFSFSICVAADSSIFSDELGGTVPEVRYCQNGECSLSGGIDLVGDTLNGIETQRSASEYIQDVVVFLLTFVSLVAVIYIIYSGARILTSGGDEEQLKTSKMRILYVCIGIVVMWLAWPITLLIFNLIGV